MNKRFSGFFRYDLLPPTPQIQDWSGHISHIGFKEFLPQNGTSAVYFFTDLAEAPVVRLTSEMHDYTERGEAGQLCFEALRDETSKKQMLFLMEFEGIANIEKLVFKRNGFLSESGIRLTRENGETVTIVASAFPYFLSIFGTTDVKYQSASEFDLESYCVENLDD